MAAAAAAEPGKGAAFYQRLTELRPDMPQAWKGLVDCLTGAGREAELPVPLLQMATIAQAKQNWQRARGLILKAAQVLMDVVGNTNAALKAVNMHIGNPEATATDADAPAERLELLARAAALEEPAADAAGQHLDALFQDAAHLSQHLTPELLSRVAEAYVARGLALISRAHGDEAKRTSWRQLAERCAALQRAGVTAAPPLAAALLRSSWYAAPPPGVDLEEIANEGRQRSAGGQLAAEAALFAAREAMDAGDAARAAQALRESAPPGDSAAATDWRRASLEALAAAASGWPDGGHADALRAVEAALEALAADALGTPLPTRDPTHPDDPKMQRSTVFAQGLTVARARLLEHLNRRDEAEAQLQQLAAAAAGAQAAEALVALGDMAARRGDAAAAKAHFESALAAAPDHVGALCGLAAAALDGGDGAAALPLAEAAVAGAGASGAAAAAAALLLGRCLWALGGARRSARDGCFAALLRAARADPGCALAFALLGRWYLEEGGDEARARGCLARALKLDAACAEAGAPLVALLLRGGQEEAAVAQCRAPPPQARSHHGLRPLVMRTAVQASWAWSALGRHYMGAGQLDEATAAASAQASWAWSALGRHYMGAGQLEEAAAHLQQALAGAPRDWRGWGDLGWVYHRQAKQAAALKAYARALAVMEEGADAASDDDAARAAAAVRILTDAGRAHREIGQVDEAAEALDRALALAPRDALARIGGAQAALARAHARATEGQNGAAADCLRRGAALAEAFLGAADGSGGSGGDGSGGDGGGGAGARTAWKLLGDLRVYAHRLPPGCFRSGNGGGGGLACEDQEEDDGVAARAAFVRGAADAYAAALAAARAEGAQGGALAAALYDLALARLLHARVLRLDFGEGCGLWPASAYEEDATIAELTQRAAEELRAALRHDALHSDAWTALGAAERDPLARQHCLARAAQLDHNPSAWACLAALYAAWRRSGEAYEALGALQAVVDHPAMWVLLGRLREDEAAEAAARDGGGGGGAPLTALSQAADAFYASLEAAPLLEGLAGLARTAALTHSLGDALVAAALRCDAAPRDPAAWALRAALLDRAGAPAAAATAYACAAARIAALTARLGASDAAAAAAALVRRGRVRALTAAGDARAAEEAAPAAEADSLAAGRALMASRQHAAAAAALAAVHGVEAARSRAAALYFAGDEAGAAAAARALLREYPGDWQAHVVALCIGGVCADVALAQAASQRLRCLAADASPPLPDPQLEACLTALHAAQRACGAPQHVSRRALSPALHLFPAAARLWAEAAAALNEGGGGGGSDGGGDAADGDPAWALKDARSCAAAAAGLVALEQRDAAARGVALFQGGAPIGRPDGRAGAHDLSRALALVSCSAVATGAGDGLREAAKALHAHPGRIATWRALALAAGARAALSADADERADLLRRAEALHAAAAAADPVVSALARARRAAAAGDTAAAIAAYKELAAAAPGTAAAWQELSACYEAQGRSAAAVAALQCGLRATGDGGGGGESAEDAGDGGGGTAAAAAQQQQQCMALHLQLALLQQRRGDLDAALQSADRACMAGRRGGKGGKAAPAAAEFVRAAIWHAAGKAKQASSGFERAMAAAEAAGAQEVPLPAELVRHYMPAKPPVAA
ncbi:hypothetical protein JKP88DRAFT_352627 [Tribonema minus]|uniref:Tetratricopeptide repeat protein 37 n=1 Tax=Tribonema minus TaxID=303371 RepID=A0A836CP95_9STRA|nr:hypothetical protein JKP88DRAFT_352627 [Tribonema minus]